MLRDMTSAPLASLVDLPLADAVPDDPLGRELLARFWRALGDPTRLALLAFCSEAERTGSECVAYAGLSQSRVSAHLACLVSCGLLTSRRDGRFVRYSLADPRVATLVTLGRAVVADHTGGIAACTKVSEQPG